MWMGCCRNNSDTFFSLSNEGFSRSTMRRTPDQHDLLYIKKQSFIHSFDDKEKSKEIDTHVR